MCTVVQIAEPNQSLGYNTLNLEVYSKPKSFVIPPRPHPAGRSPEEQPFYLSQKNVIDLWFHIAIAPGSCCLSVSQITDFETDHTF